LGGFTELAEWLCLQNVARPNKSPKLKKPKGASSALLRAMDEEAAAEAMEITGSGFEGVGLRSL
jgi:hypothetical protein